MSALELCSLVAGLVAERFVGGDHGEISGRLRVGQEAKNDLIGRSRLAENRPNSMAPGLRRRGISIEFLPHMRDGRHLKIAFVDPKKET